MVQAYEQYEKLVSILGSPANTKPLPHYAWSDDLEDGDIGKKVYDSDNNLMMMMMKTYFCFNPLRSYV